MSLNLIFYDTAAHKAIDFPFQTPTRLTEAVLAAKTTPEKLALIDAELVSRDWDKAARAKCLKEIESRLNNPAIALEVI